MSPLFGGHSGISSIRSLGLLQHQEQGGFCPCAERLFHFHPRLEAVEAIAEFLERVHFHIPAVGTSASVGGSGDEVFIRTFFAEPVEHAALGHDDDVFDRGILAVGNHLLGRADFIGKQPNSLGAFGVCDDEGVRVFGFDPADGVAGELDVDITIALPEVHFAAGLFHDPSTEVFVGHEKDGAVCGGLVDDLDGVAGGDDDVAEGFDGT